MIDTKELRRDADDAYVAHVPFEICGSELIELLDRLEAAEKDRDDIALRLVLSDIGKHEISEAHNAVTRRLSALADENTTLQAKLAGMEQQQKLGTMK